MVAVGHAWHGLLSRTQYGRFHGTSVARDFVEAPSQMLENWCFEKTVLQRISRHYQTGKPLSDETIDSIIKRSVVIMAGDVLLTIDQPLRQCRPLLLATSLHWNVGRVFLSLLIH